MGAITELDWPPGVPGWITPEDCGTNSSGPDSPTMYGVPPNTEPPACFPPPNEPISVPQKPVPLAPAPPNNPPNNFPNNPVMALAASCEAICESILAKPSRVLAKKAFGPCSNNAW